jgi:ubiquinone/menaquinone biosynthesis C-methylase UbiE
MHDIPTNISRWQNYSWPQGGDEWSHAWGGTEVLWWRTLFPRIVNFIPTDTILEIAPGFGRLTAYLKNFCRHLIIVDLVDRCIEACRERFASSSHIIYHVNDGKSLEMIPDDSIDFAFSYDSFVHVEADVLKSYLEHLARKFKPHGVGFFHHSNLGAFVDPTTGRLPFENVHWRSESVSARLFSHQCDEAGLQCVAQEIINWGGDEMIDVLSLFTKKGSPVERENVVIENRLFMTEAAYYKDLSRIYDPAHFAALKKVGRIGMVDRIDT